MNQVNDLNILSNSSLFHKIIDHDQINLIENVLIKPKRSQKFCLLCHDECVQGCSGPGSDQCTKCRNYKIVIDEDLDKVIFDFQMNLICYCCLGGIQL